MLSSILILTVSFIIYAVLHSLTAGLGLKAWARRIFGPAANRWYRLAYNIMSIVTFLPILLLLAILPDRMLYVIPFPWRWLMVGGQLLALVGLGIAFLQTNPWHFLGLTQLVQKDPPPNSPLVITGFYRRMRHPLYFFSLLFLWLTPVITVNLLAANLLFTLYFYTGSLHEEHRLTAEFGEMYRRYQQCVPRLIPLPGRCYPEMAQEMIE